VGAAVLCALLLTGAAQDPVRVTATLSADRINVGETTTLQITVETRGSAPEEIRVPRLTNELQILGTSDYTQTQITIPGGRTRATRREVIIVARSAGVFRIPPVVVRVAGMTYRTDPLDLVVSAGPGGATETSATTSSLVVTLDPDTVFVGEQVTLYAEATFAEEMRTRQSRPATFDPPAPTGFWIQDLPDPISVTLRVREGRTVETQTYRRAYFPLTPGTLHFPPARLHYEVRRGFLYSPETRELVSDSARLVVLPLPSTGRPDGFRGAVGGITLRASVAPGRVRVGEAAVLTVEVEGTGNVKALPEPVLPDVAGAEIFPPSQDSRVDITDDRVGGMKRFRWMIVPEDAGTLRIPPIEYPVFDPELRTYVVHATDTLRIDVTPVVATAAGDTALRPLRTRATGAPLGWVRSPGFAVLQAVPLLALLGIVAVRRRRERAHDKRDEAAELRRQLDDLRVAEPDSSLLAELERIARRAVSHVAGIEGDPIAGLRAQKRPAAATELENLLRDLQRLRFAPAEPFDARVLIDRVARFITLVAQRTRSGTAALVFILVPGVFIAAQRAGTAAFADGVVQFESGEYRDAMTSFAQYVEAQPRDPAGWYDLGLAAHRAGDPGRATWAWLRAIRLEPRADDARHNLRALGAAPALARTRPIDFLNTDERMLLAALGWWLTAAAIGLMLLRPHTRRLSLLMPGIMLLVLTAATGTYELARPALIAPLGDGAVLHAAPTTREMALGTLAPGEVARLVEVRDDWLLVRTSDGREAWVERSGVASL